MSTILVTGGNRGIGNAIVQQIGSRLPTSTIILGCRSVRSGNDAIQELKSNGIAANLDTVEIDIENDKSIAAAVEAIDKKYGKLDVLVNNAVRLDIVKSEDLSTMRAASNACFNNGITSNIVITHAFTGLLRKSEHPRVIMVSSIRGSLARTANKELPPVGLVDYCVVKAALNMLTVHLQNAEDLVADDQRKITYWTVSPGHCKTAFNNFRGTRDPLDGAEVVIQLLESPAEKVPGGSFWEYENGKLQMAPW